jgi:hypothetical protein
MKLLLVLIFLPFSLFAGEMNFTVSPAIVKFDTVQGSVKAFDLAFFNQSDNKLNVKVKVMGLTLDAHGVPIISKASNKPNQWAKFVELSKTKFIAKSGKSEKIHVTLNTPRGKLGGGYFAVVFNATASSEKKKSSKAQNVMSIGGQLPSLFIGEISRTGKLKAKVSKAVINKAPYTKKHPFKLRYLLKNTGTTHINVTGDVLLQYKKKVVARLKLESGSGLIFPGGSRYFTARWKGINKFSGKKLLASARFNYAGGRISKKLSIKVPLSKEK